MRGMPAKTYMPGKRRPKMTGLFSLDVKRGMKDRTRSAALILPPLFMDFRTRINPKRNSRIPIIPGKIPGLSMKSPRLGIVKESPQTNRARAVESAYLNQLVIMGYLKKERKGRKAYFFIEKDAQRD